MLSYLRAYPMVVLLIPLVVVIYLLYPKWQHYRETDEEREYAFVIRSAARETNKCYRFDTKALELGEVTLYILKDSVIPNYGDTVIARTKIERRYRRRTAFAANYLLLPTSHPTVPLQTRLYRRLEAAGLSGDELATTGALTLGYKEDLDPNLRRQFQASGAAHVLAVSGLHTGIIYALLLGLLTLGGRFKPPYENRVRRCLLSAAIITALWFYAWLTGLTPSVVRCVVMLTIVEIGRMLYRHAISLNTIAAAAVLILLARPEDLWSLGFQLSFSATAAIVVMVKPLMQVLPTFHENRSVFRHIGLSVYRYVTALLIVSIAAQLGTLPITMHTFGQVSNYFLLTNLIVLPITTFLVPFGLATIALGGTWLGQIIGIATNGLAWAMNHSVGWLERLPGSVTPIYCNFPMMALLYAAIIMGVLTLRHSLWWLTGVVAAVLGFCICLVL